MAFVQPFSLGILPDPQTNVCDKLIIRGCKPQGMQGRREKHEKCAQLCAAVIQETGSSPPRLPTLTSSTGKVQLC